MADGKLDQSVAPSEDTSKLKADVAAKFHEGLNLLPQAKPEVAKAEPAKSETVKVTGFDSLVGLAGKADVKSERSLGSIASSIAQADARTKPESSDVFDSLAKNSKVARYGMAGIEGLAYAVPGALKAVAKDVSNPLDLAAKVAVAGSIGVVMKTVLPKAGVAKAIV